MAPVVTVKTFGSAELLRRLGRLSDAAAGSSLATAGLAGGIVIERKWKSLFRKASDPSFPGSRPRRQTGQYAQSVHTVVLEQGRSHAVVAVGTSITAPPYPEFLEYGTSKMPPHPIARPALDQSKGEALREVTRVLKIELGL